MSSLKNLALSCLNEMQSGEFHVSYETVLELINFLEERNDPSEKDIELISVCYEYVEKFKLMQGALQSLLKNENKLLLGNRLQTLYNKSID